MKNRQVRLILASHNVGVSISRQLIDPKMAGSYRKGISSVELNRKRAVFVPRGRSWDDAFNSAGFLDLLWPRYS
jgi:hypothetical protein